MLNANFAALRVLHYFSTDGHEIYCHLLCVHHLFHYFCEMCIVLSSLTLLQLRAYTNRPPTHIHTSDLIITKLFLEPHLAIFVCALMLYVHFSDGCLLCSVNLWPLIMPLIFCFPHLITTHTHSDKNLCRDVLFVYLFISFVLGQL